MTSFIAGQFVLLSQQRKMHFVENWMFCPGCVSGVVATAILVCFRSLL